MKIGQTHVVWSSLEFTISDVRKGIAKSRMLTGTYLLQSNRFKFNNSTENPICKCCGLETEDIVHMLLDCPALYSQRKQYFTHLKSLIVNCVGIEQWNQLFNNTKEKLTRLILDCSSFACLTEKGTELCQRLHLRRLQKLNQ